MAKILSIIPAYGRDYKSKKEVIDDLKANKDFRIADVSSPYDGGYIGLSDIKANFDEVKVRYGKLAKVAIIDIEKEIK